MWAIGKLYTPLPSLSEGLYLHKYKLSEDNKRYVFDGSGRRFCSGDWFLLYNKRKNAETDHTHLFLLADNKFWMYSLGLLAKPLLVSKEEWDVLGHGR